MSKRRPVRHTERFNLIPIFSKLRGQETGRILKICDQVTATAGTDIFKPGDPANGFYLILEGRIDIRRPPEDAGGGPLTLATLSNRSVFGEMSFLHKRPRSAFATAVKKTKLNLVRGDDFTALLDEGDIAAYKVIHNIALLTGTRLRRMEKELLMVLDAVDEKAKTKKLAELQQFRQTLFQEWSF